MNQFDTSELPKPSKVVAPPWQLKGNGYIFIFKFLRAFVEQNAFLAEYQQNCFDGFFGTIMLVDYTESGVGAYQELLFVPGIFNFGGKKHYSISKIYVSSYDSVWNGAEKWGIPKELAEFRIQKPNKKEDIFEVSLRENTFFKAHLQKRKVYFPNQYKVFSTKTRPKVRK